MSRQWPEWKVEIVRQHAARGLQARQIAETMGPGYTRNMIISVCHRNGIDLTVGRKINPQIPEPPKVPPAPQRTRSRRHPLCDTPGCRGPAQPGRAHCAECNTVKKCRTAA